LPWWRCSRRSLATPGAREPRARRRCVSAWRMPRRPRLRQRLSKDVPSGNSLRRDARFKRGGNQAFAVLSGTCQPVCLQVVSGRRLGRIRSCTTRWRPRHG
jgi:hypothetical protein